MPQTYSTGQLLSATTKCPACHGTVLRVEYDFPLEASANHLIPPRRAPERNERLRVALRDLWEADSVRIQRCQTCGFGFSDPFVAGSEDVYNVIGGGAQHYPRDRFEFSVTTDALKARGGVDRLLEVGAGSGAFIHQMLSEGLAKAVTATEYDESAVAALRRLGGVEVHQGDFRGRDDMGRYDAICLFQVMEHLDDLDGAFEAFTRLLNPSGELFIGVPNGDRTDSQERLTHFMDMPPVHIGRWTTKAMAAIADRHGFDVVEERLNPRPAVAELSKLAVYRLEQRTRDPRTVVSRIESIGFRPLRGALKRAAAGWDLAVLAPQLGKVPPTCRWFHLRRRP